MKHSIYMFHDYFLHNSSGGFCTRTHSSFKHPQTLLIKIVCSPFSSWRGTGRNASPNGCFLLKIQKILVALLGHPFQAAASCAGQHCWTSCHSKVWCFISVFFLWCLCEYPPASKGGEMASFLCPKEMAEALIPFRAPGKPRTRWEEARAHFYTEG